MSKNNIVLIGFMGSGKTTCADKLGQILSCRVISSDSLIIEREGRPIKDIFADSGEDYFRRIEKEVIKDISRMENIVVDCGGGVVLDHENIDNLKVNGVVFYLKASADFIYECIKGQTHRPLLNVPDPKARIIELLKIREPYYAQADITIDTDNMSIENICEEILKRIEE